MSYQRATDRTSRLERTIRTLFLSLVCTLTVLGCPNTATTPRLVGASVLAVSRPGRYRYPSAAARSRRRAGSASNAEASSSGAVRAMAAIGMAAR